MQRQWQVVLLVVLVAAVVCLAGCPLSRLRGGTPPTPPPGPVAGPTSGPAAIVPAAGSMSGLEAKRAGLKSYVMVMTTPQGQAVKQAVKLENGKPVRMKVTSGPGQDYVLMLLDQAEFYMYQAKQKTAMKMPLPPPDQKQPAALGQLPSVPKLEDLKAPAAPQTEMVDGVECWVFETLSVGGQGATRVWLDQQWGLPRQMDLGGKLTKLKYFKINQVLDSEFELPAGTKITEASKSLEGLKNLPKPPNP